MPILGPSTDYTEAPKLAPHGGPTGRRLGRPRRVWVREDAFDVLDVEASYWLGFIIADGSIDIPRWMLTVHLAEKDREHLVALQAFLGGTIGETKTGPRLIACSRRLVEGLIARGVMPRKSYGSGEPPSLEGDARIALLRGLFDGDGCLHVTQRGHLQAAFCGRDELVAWFVKQIAIETNGVPSTRGGCVYAQWTSGIRARAIAALLYDAPGPRLARKNAIAKGN